MPTAFFAFRDAQERRAALSAPEALDRYRLFGLDEVRAHGARVRHNLEREDAPPRWMRGTASGVNRFLRRYGGLRRRLRLRLRLARTANEADVVFATTDTSGFRWSC